MRILFFLSLILLAVLLLHFPVKYIADKINSESVFGKENGTYRTYGTKNRIIIRRK